MFKRFYKNRYGYSRWDGTQHIEGLDADDILNALSDDYHGGWQPATGAQTPDAGWHSQRRWSPLRWGCAS